MFTVLLLFICQAIKTIHRYNSVRKTIKCESSLFVNFTFNLCFSESSDIFSGRKMNTIILRCVRNDVNSSVDVTSRSFYGILAVGLLYVVEPPVNMLT